METHTPTPDGKVPFEYLLIISPDQDVFEKLVNIKQHFKEAYQCRFAAHLKPHITLVRFFQLEEREPLIKEKFQNLSNGVSPIQIELDGFGQFPTHTVFADVKTQEPIKNIVDGIKSQFQELLRLGKKFTPHFSTKPHMTIARRMTEEQFRRAWEDWQDQPLHAAFLADEMVLLKKQWTQEGRPIGPYTIAGTFPFRGKTGGGTAE
ncbi:2'-5' RNA ligase family protein [Negadavirga shengliensis]|uniref:2'-5' RNA ligase family protein n=1 Tax=Negadavirga shengliensis TaxID=1389218 RepID=A0ABV9SWE5_9BACT